MGVEERRRQHIDCLDARSVCRFDGRPYLFGPRDLMNRKFNAAPTRSILQCLGLRGCRGGAIGKGRHAASGRHQLHQYFLSLAVEFGRKNADSGGIPTGSGKRTHVALYEHIVGYPEQRNGRRRQLCRANRIISAADDYIDPSFNNLRKLLGTACKAATIDYEVLALDKAKPAKLVKKGDELRHLARQWVQKTEAIRAARLLRLHPERPCSRRAAKQGDELAPPHTNSLSGLRPEFSIFETIARRAYAVYGR
jgi:hypothetical protein